jgi:hypothetical protein
MTEAADHFHEVVLRKHDVLFPLDCIRASQPLVTIAILGDGRQLYRQNDRQNISLEADCPQ